VPQRVACSTASRVGSGDAALAGLRSEAVELVTASIEQASSRSGAEAAKHSLDRMVDRSTRIPLLRRPDLQQRGKALMADLQGRMRKALDGQDRFQRWGRHYLRAITRAHQLQLCTNFMDPGLQVYGGQLFWSLVEHGSAIFKALPPPTTASKASNAPVTARGRPTTTPAARAPRPRSPSPVQSETYYQGGGGGCFGSSSRVQVVEDGTTQLIAAQHVRVGDMLRVVGGVAKVHCVVKLAHSTSSKLAALEGGLTITGRHPVRVGGVWRRPCDLTEDFVEHEGWIYNFVLEGALRVVLVEGWECVTFGHGLTADVAAHSYYGTDAVIKDLAVLPGWKDGHVAVSGKLRDVAALHRQSVHSAACSAHNACDSAGIKAC